VVLASSVLHDALATERFTAEPLGDRIAEALCYPPSARRLEVSGAERARLLSAPPLTGAYRDIQGSEARAWFEVLENGTARCRRPANSAMTVWFCAEVTLDGDALVRDRIQLCY
jgi:hypothetical protein